MKKQSIYCENRPKFFVAVDCIIMGFLAGGLNLLLLKQNYKPTMGYWSLMGGFVQEEESVDSAAKRVLFELTGLNDIYMEQVGTFGDISRDPGERVISVAYCALLNIKESDKKLVEQHNASWVNINELPSLIFDHTEMIEHALKLIRLKVTNAPICFELLPKLFTLTQLQKLYESIFDEVIDKRNFRKRVAEMKYIEKTDKIDKASSKRGAALYKFNRKVCQKDQKFKL